MTRLYTFGCSFTQYYWPTWADILGREFDQFENWGQCGGGNQFIFNSITECLIKNKLNKNDTVVVMWTNVTREDRYVGHRWLTPGNVYTYQTVYDQTFVEKFADVKGYYLRDLATIHAAKRMLDSYDISYIFTSMVPIKNSDQYNVNQVTELDEQFNLYSESLSIFRPSIFESIFNFDWSSKPIVGQSKRLNSHPTPGEHLEYVNKILPEFTVSNETEDWVSMINQKVLDENLNIENIKLQDLWNNQISFPNRW
jgi:hypothetical protein